MKVVLFCGGMEMRMKEVGSEIPMGLRGLNSKRGGCLAAHPLSSSSGFNRP